MCPPHKRQALGGESSQDRFVKCLECTQNYSMRDCPKLSLTASQLRNTGKPSYQAPELWFNWKSSPNYPERSPCSVQPTPSLFWMSSIIILMRHTLNDKGSFLILLFWGTFQVKITCEVICLMQFPTNSLVSQCINTTRLILMTQNKKQQDWEQTHVQIPWCKSATLRANHRAKPGTCLHGRGHKKGFQDSNTSIHKAWLVVPWEMKQPAKQD